VLKFLERGEERVNFEKKCKWCKCLSGSDKQYTCVHPVETFDEKNYAKEIMSYWCIRQRCLAWCKWKCLKNNG
jgi:hypothetical protein